MYRAGVRLCFGRWTRGPGALWSEGDAYLESLGEGRSTPRVLSSWTEGKLEHACDLFEFSAAKDLVVANLGASSPGHVQGGRQEEALGRPCGDVLGRTREKKEKILGFAEIGRERVCPQNPPPLPLRGHLKGRNRPYDLKSQNTPEEAQTSSHKELSNGLVVGFF